MLVTMPVLIAANAAALFLAIGRLARLTVPMARAVRVRNAFLLRRGQPADFAWTPQSVPAGFRVEHRRAPEIIQSAVAESGALEDVGDWPRTIALVTMLMRPSRQEGAIQADLATTYQSIVSGSGNCSDYVRVFLAAASASGLFCRQWAFSFDGFGGHGHTFVEVYDRQRSRWIFLDVHNNVYATRPNSDVMLSAMELRSVLLESSEVDLRRASEGRLGWEDSSKLLDYYRRGLDEWYLWWGNDVISRDRTGLAAVLSIVSGRLSHRLTSAFRLPPLVAVVTGDNERSVTRMEDLRRQVIGAITIVSTLAVTLTLLLDLSLR